MSKFLLDASVRSDVGNVRKNNEDNYFLCGEYREDVNLNDSRKECRVTDDKALFSVCDGMGGEAHGEIASLVAVANMRGFESKDFGAPVHEDVLRLNELVCEEVRKRGRMRMGSTLTNIYIDNGKAIATNLGDSRSYLLRNGELSRLSVDHDEATHLMQLGLLTEEEAATDGRRHQLTQFLGMMEDDIIPVPFVGDVIDLKAGDRFLICSDGITDVLSDDDIRDILSVKDKAGKASNDLVETALLKNSKDNCTAMVIDVKKKPLFKLW